LAETYKGKLSPGPIYMVKDQAENKYTNVLLNSRNQIGLLAKIPE
jgi:hypothetical protein